MPCQVPLVKFLRSALLTVFWVVRRTREIIGKKDVVVSVMSFRKNMVLGCYGFEEMGGGVCGRRGDSFLPSGTSVVSGGKVETFLLCSV